jgi:hypothetical protein
MVIMGAGMGFVLVGVQNAANGGVPADKSGLAASLITASFQLGSALGLAIFVSLATSRTHHLLATHTQPPEALTLGFQRGLLGAGIALVIAAVIALRATNVRVVDMASGAEEDMAPGAEDNQALPVPVAGSWSCGLAVLALPHGRRRRVSQTGTCDLGGRRLGQFLASGHTSWGADSRPYWYRASG